MSRAIGRVSTPAGERVLIDDGKVGPIVLAEGLASLRATAHVVRIDFYDDSAPDTGNEPAVTLALRIAMPVDAFLRFAGEISMHAANIESILQSNTIRDNAPEGLTIESAKALPDIGDQIG
jgi:hypothetical protein